MEKLGWNQKKWDNDIDPPSEDKNWDELDKKEKKAAIMLGYNQEKWDKGKSSKKCTKTCDCRYEAGTSRCRAHHGCLENICKEMKGMCLSASGYWSKSRAHCSNAKINCKKNTCKDIVYYA